MSQEDRRNIQRVRFDSPIGAKFDVHPATIIDISKDGARIEHDFPLPSGKKVNLSFAFDDNEIELLCLVVRCKLEKRGNSAIYASGVHFEETDDGSLELLRRCLSSILQSDFEARQSHIAELE